MSDDRLAGDLLAEVERYLSAVEVFRAERCEPTWLPESASGEAPHGRTRARSGRESPAPGAKSSH